MHRRESSALGKLPVPLPSPAKKPDTITISAWQQPASQIISTRESARLVSFKYELNGSAPMYRRRFEVVQQPVFRKKTVRDRPLPEDLQILLA